MLRVAVVDDDAQDRAKISAGLDFVAAQKDVSFSISEFDSGDQFLVKYEPNYDIVFMDVEFLSGANGIEAAHQLRKIDKTVVLVFVTRMAQMAVKGYEVDKMTRILDRVAIRPDDMFCVCAEGEIISLHIRMLRYLTVDGHYVIYHSKEGTFAEYITLNAAERKLNDPAFFRCDRGCLVNLRYVEQIRKSTCLVDGEELPIARTQFGKFKQAYARYLGGLIE